jgi:hypothetical protein
VVLLSAGVVRYRWTVALLVAIWVLPIVVPVRSPPVIPWLAAPMVTLLIAALAAEMVRRPAAVALTSRKSA